MKATRGDSVYEEDADTLALEARIAKLTGKEDCLFAVSGTMTNRKFTYVPLLIFLRRREVGSFLTEEGVKVEKSRSLTIELAIRTHLKQPPHSVIVDWRAHVHKMEGE